MRNKQKQVQLRDVKDVLDIIGGRWRGAILASLCDKPKRFNELKRDIGGITSRSLAKELKYLEMNRLLLRREDAKETAAVLYNLTAHGYSLDPLIGEIVKWGQKHRKIIMSK